MAVLKHTSATAWPGCAEAGGPFEHGPSASTSSALCLRSTQNAARKAASGWGRLSVILFRTSSCRFFSVNEGLRS